MSYGALLRIAVSFCCLAAALQLMRRRMAAPTAWLLMAGALLLPLLGSPQTSPAPVFTASLVAGPLLPACAAVAALVWPVAPLTGWHRSAAVGAMAVAVLSGVGPSLVWDPGAAGCNDCSANLLRIRSDPALATSMDRGAKVLTLAWSVLVAILVIRRWARAPRLDRRIMSPVLLAGAAVATLTAAQVVRTLRRPDDVFDPLAGAVTMAEICLLLVIAAGVGFRLTLPRRVSGRVARSILRATPEPQELVASLAAIVGDPDLAVAYQRWNGQLIGLDGHLSPRPAGKAALRLAHDGAVYAEIRYSDRLPGAADDLVRAAARSSGPSLAYFAAQARLRAETLEAVKARRRIVTAADSERRRLERDLHDGAQQGLIALSLQLTAVTSALPSAGGDNAPLDRAQREIARALEELRGVARGVFPVSLAEAGLRSALRELGDHTPVPLQVEGTLDTPLSLPAGMALYHLVLDVLDSAMPGSGSAVRVTLDGEDHSLARIRITAPPPNHEWSRRRFISSEDRLVALGGGLSVRLAATSLTVEGAVPCGS